MTRIDAHLHSGAAITIWQADLGDRVPAVDDRGNYYEAFISIFRPNNHCPQNDSKLVCHWR